jgi:thioredoxin 2
MAKPISMPEDTSMNGLVRCSHCGQMNQVPAAAAGTPRCGKCHKQLPWITGADDATFGEVAEGAKIPVLVDLWAPWSGPDRMVSPVLDQLARDLAGQVKLVKVNVDVSPQLSQRFDVQNIPTMLMLRDGRVIARREGTAPLAALRAWVDNALGRSEEAVGVFDQVVDRFGEDTELAVRGQAATALVYKGITLGQLDDEPAQGVNNPIGVPPGPGRQMLGRPDDVMQVYDQVVARFGADTEPAVRGQAATALVNQGVRLGQLGRPDDEMQVYDQVVARFGEDTEPAVRKWAANAVQLKAEIVSVRRRDVRIPKIWSAAAWRRR